MKLDTAVLTKNVGNLDTSDSTKMGFSAKGASLILRLLSNLYPNPDLAVLREYACNALDSHIEAGQTRPVEVTLPNRLDPKLVVKDYGTGLSKTQMMEVYATYAESTKANSNDFIGMMGIGSKSAFSIANEFTVKANKDGQTVVILFLIDDDGDPAYELLFEGPTDEPNGVEVSVPVSNVEAMVRASKNLFGFWRPGSILVDGQAPASRWDYYTKIQEGLYVNWGGGEWDGFDRYNDSLIVLMGGIPYFLSHEVISALDIDQQNLANAADSMEANFVIDCPIGSLSLPPERESLKITGKTIATLNKALAALQGAILEEIDRRIQGSSSVYEAAQMYVNSIRTFALNHNPANQPKWHGKSLGDWTVRMTAHRFMLERPRGKRGYYGYSTDYSAHRLGHEPKAEVEFYMDKTSNLKNVLIVTGVKDEKQLKTMRLVAKDILLSDDVWNYQAALNSRFILAVPATKIENGWFAYGEGTSNPAVSWVSFDSFIAQGKDLRKKRLAIHGGSGGGTTYSVRMPDNTTDTMTAAQIKDEDFKIIWSSGFVPHTLTGGLMGPLWNTGDYMIIRLSSRQSTDKFKRLFPEALYFYDLLREEAEKVMDSVDATDLRLLQAQQGSASNALVAMNWLYDKDKAGTLTNPAVRAYLQQNPKAHDLTAAEIERVELIMEASRATGRALPATTSRDDARWLKDNLPLFYTLISYDYAMRSTLGRTPTTELIEHVNQTVIPS